MKRITCLLLLTFALCSAEEITLTKSAMMRTERSLVSLKAGTVVELLGRNEKTLTVRYNQLTGVIPVGSIAAVAEVAKKDEPPPLAPPPARKAETMYGKAVEKAKENAAKHDKNVVKPTDEILDGK